MGLRPTKSHENLGLTGARRVSDPRAQAAALFFNGVAMGLGPPGRMKTLGAVRECVRFSPTSSGGGPGVDTNVDAARRSACAT
jgi:hypothetical protein